MPDIPLKNTGNKWPLLRVFIDSDVLFAGSTSPNTHSASNVILQMAEITLIEAIISKQVITEVSRNLEEKIPGALPVFDRIVHQCVQVIPDPSLQEVKNFTKQADWKDVPVLAAAVNAGCRYLLTYNVRDYWPNTTDISVLQPGEFIKYVRKKLSELG